MSSGVDVALNVEEHYRSLWGAPSRRATFRRPDLRIDVWKWNDRETDLGVDMYATIGASVVDMVGADTGHRVEFFLGLRPGQDEVASALAGLGLFSQREGEELGHGHTVGAGGPLWPGTSMDSFLLHEAESILPTLPLDEGIHVQFLHAIPIYEPERRFKVANGVDALMQRWQEAGVRFADASREPEPRR